MELRTLLAVLRRGWFLIVISAATTVAVAGLYLSTSTPTYSASAEYLISPRPTGSANDTYQAGLYVTGRMPSYAALATSASVADRVAAELRLPDSPDSLAAQVTASVPTDTTIVDIAASADDPERAQQLANSFGEQFAVAVRQLEGEGQNSVVRVTALAPAQLPSSPVSPRRKLILAAALLLGLGVGVLAAVLRSRFADPRTGGLPGASWFRSAAAGTRRAPNKPSRAAASRTATARSAIPADPAAGTSAPAAPAPSPEQGEPETQPTGWRWI
jgi:capsular polysaccharide biosynthesis protein